jgi:hypothetical protein
VGDAHAADFFPENQGSICVQKERRAEDLSGNACIDLQYACKDGQDVGTLPKGYIRNVPLLRVPPTQSAKSRVQVHTIPEYYKAKYAVPAYNSPSSIVKSAAYAFSPAWHAIAINT